MGRGRHGVQLEDSPAHRRVPAQDVARPRDKRPLLRFEPFLDFEKFADTMLATRRMGIFTIGGGVPRNWSQQFGVYAELLARRGYKKIPLKRYNYGVRICPEPVHWGGLSGSTYTEAVSWGKFVPPEEGGRFAEVFDDATVALPLIVRAVLERIGYFKRKNHGANGSRPSTSWGPTARGGLRNARAERAEK